jgi:hypothetical protein
LPAYKRRQDFLEGQAVIQPHETEQ